MTDRALEILLVEDDPNDRELALYCFRKQNLANRVQVANNGPEALQFIFRRGRYERRVDDPRLVLLDLDLPLVDGLEVLRQVKESPRTRSIPVVMLTSSREVSDMVESYQLGVDSYIVKPVDFDEFTGSVRALGQYWLLLNQPSPIVIDETTSEP